MNKPFKLYALMKDLPESLLYNTTYIQFNSETFIKVGMISIFRLIQNQ